VVSHHSRRRSGQPFSHLRKYIQPFRGSARDNEDKQGKSLCDDYSQDSLAYGNSSIPQSKAAGVRRRSALKFGTPLGWVVGIDPLAVDVYPERLLVALHSDYDSLEVVG
jgi:hypothetical protein